jgi:ferredoxin
MPDTTVDLRIVTRRGVIEIPGRGTLLARLMSGGIPVASSCSGRGSCGKCIVTVLEGADALTPADAHELEVLERNNALPETRLACQCRVVPGGVVAVTTGYW